MEGMLAEVRMFAGNFAPRHLGFMSRAIAAYKSKSSAFLNHWNHLWWRWPHNFCLAGSSWQGTYWSWKWSRLE